MHYARDRVNQLYFSSSSASRPIQTLATSKTSENCTSKNYIASKRVSHPNDQNS